MIEKSVRIVHSGVVIKIGKVTSFLDEHLVFKCNLIIIRINLISIAQFHA